MERLLKIRQEIISLYRLHQTLADLVLKFMAGILFFAYISTFSMGTIGSTKKFLAILVFSVLTAVVPAGFFHIVVIFATGLFLSFASIETAVFVVLVGLAAYLFYIRIFPCESLLIPAMLICGFLKIPYAVPIFAGLYIGVSGIVPVCMGAVALWFVPLLQKLVQAAPKADFTPMGMPDAFIKIYVLVMDYVTSGNGLIASVVIFALTVIIVYGVSYFDFDFGKEKAIIAGGAFMAVAYIGTTLLDKSTAGVLTVIIGVAAGTAIVFIIQFFDMVLDYRGSRRVQFQDKENYYYVKVVPKILMNKHHSSHTENQEEPIDDEAKEQGKA